MMSPRFKTKELFLLVPVLGFMGAAFYWTRTKNSTTGLNLFDNNLLTRGPYIESVKFETAPGDKREQGFSHTLTVTLNHSWPRPAYWNDCCGVSVTFDSSERYTTAASMFRSGAYKSYAMAQGGVIWKHNGKSVLFGQKRGPQGYGTFKRENGRLIFTRDLALQKVPPQGEVDFDGAYTLIGRPTINVHQILRKEGDKLTFDTSHITGGRLLSATATSWEDVNTVTASFGKTPPKTTVDDRLDISLKVQCVPSTTDELPKFDIHDVELVDGKKRVYRVGGSNFLWFPQETPTKKPTSGEYRLSPAITLGTGSGFRPPNPLTLRGKISIEHQWPLPFSIKLPHLN